MHTWNLPWKIGQALVSSIKNGIDYVAYLVSEFLNKGKDDGWDVEELRNIEPMPAEPTRQINTSTGKINLRMMDND